MNEPASSPGRWWRFTFSVRGLLLATALCCAWLAMQRDWARQRREYLAQERSVAAAGLEYGPYVGNRRARAPGLLPLLGDEGVGMLHFQFIIDSDQPLTSDTLAFEQAFQRSPHARRLARARQLFPEAEITWSWSARLVPRAAQAAP